MQIKTILNRIQKHRGFVYDTVQLDERPGGLVLEVDIYPHARNRPQCSECGRRGPQYDRLAPRRFEFVPLWGISVFFLYMMPRRLCEVWRPRRAGPLGRRQAPIDDDLRVVPRALGEAPQLAGGRHGLSDQLGPGVSVGRHGRRLGSRSRESGRH